MVIQLVMTLMAHVSRIHRNGLDADHAIMVDLPQNGIM